MDPNNPAQPAWKQPHVPISEAEMTHPEHDNKGRNTLLTLASLLVLTGIVGITLWLYIQNKSGNQSLTGDQNKNPENNGEQPQGEDLEAMLATMPTLTEKEQEERYGDVVCRRFTTISDALQAPEIACSLDLSGQELSKLPNSISKLSSLTEINLSNNNFSEFPKELINLPNIVIINLENNRLSTIPVGLEKSLPKVQQILLNGNGLPSETVKSYSEINRLKIPASR